MFLKWYCYYSFWEPHKHAWLWIYGVTIILLSQLVRGMALAPFLYLATCRIEPRVKDWEIGSNDLIQLPTTNASDRVGELWPIIFYWVSNLPSLSCPLPSKSLGKFWERSRYLCRSQGATEMWLFPSTVVLRQRSLSSWSQPTLVHTRTATGINSCSKIPLNHWLFTCLATPGCSCSVV